MKLLMAMTLVLMTFLTKAAVPTEEGLLKNLNNAGVQGNLITVKTMIQPALNVTPGGSEAENARTDFYKFIISTENPNVFSLLQVAYSNGQMLNSQIKDIKFIPDIITAIKREKNPERSMFYGLLVMLTTNQSKGVEVFLEKSGIQIVKNKEILNEEKLKLLKAYRTYLANNPGKGDTNSPLNPADPQNKAKILELFRSNTFERAKNIELVKLNNEFLWKVDWKNIKAYFTNEDRRFRLLENNLGDTSVRVEANDYVVFNGINELPKFLSFKDTKGMSTKIQVLSLETKVNREKKINERFEEIKKLNPATPADLYSFLF